jgi:membrane AbrB-like protein
MKPARDRALNPALAFALCGAAGVVFSWWRIPLPWMIGPLSVMAVCNFAGAGLRAVPRGREAGQVVIGTALGLYFMPAVAQEVISFWPLLLFAGAFAIALGVLAAWILRAVAGSDATTAFFASVPGGAAEMTLLGEKYGGRPDLIALAQSLRILVVVVVVPIALTTVLGHSRDVYVPVSASLSMGGLMILLGVASVAGALAARLGMPNAFFFGPLVAAIALTISEVQLSSIPTPLSNTAQVLIGCALGSRFERRSLERAPRFVAGILLGVFAAITLCAAMAALIAWAADLSAPTLVLAMAPGGIAEMCITAKVLQLGVPLVTAAHVARVLVLITATGPSYRAAVQLAARLRTL